MRDPAVRVTSGCVPSGAMAQLKAVPVTTPSADEGSAIGLPDEQAVKAKLIRTAMAAPGSKGVINR
jgi:hypothetical protein